ncbi:two component, sigma54 specific, transcriptional regulator, Fis family [Ferrimonas balearica DSM 9799]|uniref:Two component, sigma54 specific, transcriptional regulator, Fis family n=1 Tax=Ferrimonas balearica (strain DSM 9799 / CCM 4581 / KCTC 23876 / PAT) TaxID=550540 RepID=E1SPH9_FERBD|nr:sigma-54 dependent transcriptional regulator [Ferrimonas balearica]MBY6019255.1 sigma-54 dependent transcriptional regulator [Halomonas denitrificans]ADN77796.1 two component, sigma54 specific, transcriptional regulator, Fis family [Ferrimonas balearica DSM 9799]MBW3140837.1 sigma-54 dependent transcriptional regulator [Ferrimonas balearica]MBW3165960.1 sigma-54 dependent transcriptional regulator [Ferrimonas balearica]MBY5981870.1 sigma-54 dependent transcriptional regulator [Ferrimonas ba
MVDKIPASTAMSVLVVDDESGMRSFLKKALSKRFALVEVAGSVEEAEQLRSRCHFDLLIVDISLPGRDGIEWHEALDMDTRRSDVIFMTGFADMETAIRALRAGAVDFILKPFRLEQMMQAVDRCIERRLLRRENLLLRREVAHTHPNTIIGNSAAMAEVKSVIGRVAATNAVVLIEGESGTGKELVARSLHQMSGRSGSFVAVNCGAIAPELLESELFGHVAGAFTGARGAREGLFSFASGGTIFLDEIGEMPLQMQTALLRVLEQRTIRPVGSEKESPVDVRVVAATNRELQLEVEEGRFRRDLYYRLNVLNIRIPSLKERPEDVVDLVHFFTRQLATELGLREVAWSHEDLQVMQRYDWPGNIRELRNLVERCLLLGKPPAEYWRSQETPVAEAPAGAGYPDDMELKEVERLHVLQVVAAQEGNKSAAARVLGVSRKTLDRKFKEWGQEGGC